MNVRTIRIAIPYASRTEAGRFHARNFIIPGQSAENGAWGPWWVSTFAFLKSLYEDGPVEVDPDGTQIRRVTLEGMKRHLLVATLSSAGEGELRENKNLAYAVEQLPKTDVPVEILYYS